MLLLCPSQFHGQQEATTSAMAPSETKTEGLCYDKWPLLLYKVIFKDTQHTLTNHNTCFDFLYLVSSAYVIKKHMFR
jgi:hypothetical protein